MWPRLTFQSETRSLCVRFTFSFTVNTSLTLPASCYYCCQHAGRAVLVHSGAEKSPGRGQQHESEGRRLWCELSGHLRSRSPGKAREAALWMHLFQFLAQSSATITLYSKEFFSSERCTKEDCCLCTALIHVSFVSSGPPCICQWKLPRRYVAQHERVEVDYSWSSLNSTLRVRSAGGCVDRCQLSQVMLRSADCDIRLLSSTNSVLVSSTNMYKKHTLVFIHPFITYMLYRLQSEAGFKAWGE